MKSDERENGRESEGVKRDWMVRREWKRGFETNQKDGNVNKRQR